MESITLKSKFLEKMRLHPETVKNRERRQRRKRKKKCSSKHTEGTDMIG